MNIILDFINQTPQKPLFHYTDANGLLGIFREGSIWASSAYHLNDAIEFRYAVALIADRLQYRSKHENGPWNEEYGRLLESMERAPDYIQVFIASFSEEGDLLSQWLAYSGQANGYSIGVSASHFAIALKQGFRLVRCIYDEEDQRKLADAVIDALCQRGQSIQHDNDEDVDQLVAAAAAAMKHPGFQREAEWRLVKGFIVWEMPKLYFREGRNGVVPYVKIPLATSDANFIPESLYIGPNDDMKAARLAMKTFLSSYGFVSMLGKDKVEVFPSKTPYRP